MCLNRVNFKNYFSECYKRMYLITGVYSMMCYKSGIIWFLLRIFWFWYNTELTWLVLHVTGGITSPHPSSQLSTISCPFNSYAFRTSLESFQKFVSHMLAFHVVCGLRCFVVKIYFTFIYLHIQYAIVGFDLFI